MQQLPAFMQNIQKQSYATPTVFGGLSKTEEKIKSIATQKQTQPEPVNTKRDTQKFFDDVTKIKQNEWYDDQTAIIEAAKFYKGKWYEVEGINFDDILQQSEPVAPVEEDKNFLEKTGEVYKDVLSWQKNIVGWAAANIPNMIWNTFWFLADVVTPKEFEGLGDFFRESWVRDKESLQKVLWVDPDAFTTKAWEFGSEIATLFIPWGQAKLAAKFPQAADKISDIAKAVDNLWENSPKVYNAIKWLVQSSAKWASEVGKLEVISEWEVTPEWLAIGAVANPVIWTTIKGIGKITKPIAEKLEVMGLLNPAKLKTITDQLKTEWVENVSVSEFLLKRNIKWTKESIVKQLDDIANASKLSVDEAINKIPWNFKLESADDILAYLRKDLADVPWQKEVVNRVTQLFKKSKSWEGLTLKELQETKRLIDRNLSLFTIPWDVKAGATKQWLAKLRADIQRFIENTAKDNWVTNIKQLNKDTQVSRTLIDAIERKESADQVREVLSAFSTSWVGAGLWGIWAIAQGQDPMTVLKSMVIGGTLWGVAWSTRIKTNVANILNKLTPTERKGIMDFIDSDWLKPINTALLEKIKDLSTNQE